MSQKSIESLRFYIYFRTPSPWFGQARKTDRPEPTIEDESMNKLIIALCASAFAFGSVSALAGNDMKPLSKMETQEAKTARAAA